MIESHLSGLVPELDTYRGMPPGLPLLRKKVSNFPVVLKGRQRFARLLQDEITIILLQNAPKIGIF